MYKFIVQEKEDISDIIFHNNLEDMIKDVHECISQYNLIENEISHDFKPCKNYITLMSWKSNGKTKGKYTLCIHKNDIDKHKDNIESLKSYAAKMLLFNKKDLQDNEKEIESLISSVSYDDLDKMARIFRRSKLSDPVQFFRAIYGYDRKDLYRVCVHIMNNCLNMYSDQEGSSEKILDNIAIHCFPNQLTTGIVPLIHTYLTKKLQQTSGIEFVDFK